MVFGFQGVIHYPPLAQLVEQLTLNQWVPGSSPTGGATDSRHECGGYRIFKDYGPLAQLVRAAGS